ncbi:unnamed protein product [Dicrocoelium dendriticum]|nr:unnamed protein product [Dicrocoelium dendriticum]
MRTTLSGKSRSVRVKRIRRSTRPLRNRNYSGSDESTIPAVGQNLDTPIHQSPRPLSHKSARVRRTALRHQCLEDLYSRTPDSEAGSLLPLAIYDRVSTICDRPFEIVDEWIAAGFPKCFELCQLVTQPTRLVIWLAERRLIANCFTCDKCFEPMLLRSAKLQRHMYLWVCRTCNRKFSIRIGSMFLKAGVLEPSIILMLYLWSVGYTVDFCAAEVECSPTSARWYICLALKSAAAQLRRDFQPLSGIVELEWHSFLQPTSRRDGLSLLCGVERSTRKVFAVPCLKPHDKLTVRRLIQNNVEPGSVIVTRDIPLFTALQLRSLGYPHYLQDSPHQIALDDVVIDLSLVNEFIDGIESHIRKLGGPGIGCTDLLLAEVIVRRTWGSQLLPMIIYSLAKTYHVKP